MKGLCLMMACLKRGNVTETVHDISVIICAYTEERWNDLVAAVESVQQQTYPAERDHCGRRPQPGFIEASAGTAIRGGCSGEHRGARAVRRT